MSPICIPYILLITILALCAAYYEYTEDEEKKTYTTFIAVGIVFIFFAFRGYVGTDWTNYTQLLKYAEWSDLYDWSLSKDKILEPGFLILTLLCKSVLNDYFFLVFVCTAIDFFLFLRFLKRWNIRNVAFVLMVFSTFGGPLLMFNLLRNTIALMIFLNALEYIDQRKPLQYFAICTLALSFHLSSLLFFPLYFFLHRRINKWFFITAFILCILFYIRKVSFVSLIVSLLDAGGAIGDKIEAYTEYYSGSNSIRLLTILEHFILAALTFIFYDELIEKNKNRILIINSLLIFLIVFYMMAEFLVLSQRFALLFYFSYWILWLDILDTLYITNNKKLMFGLFYLYCVVIQIGNYHEQTAYYDNILFGYQSYEEREKTFYRTFEEFGK